jgi:hypothetical protein
MPRVHCCRILSASMDYVMKRTLSGFICCFSLICLVSAFAASESTKILLGSWSGKATGPQGGPPTGNIMLLIEKASGGLEGTLTVTAAGGAKYSGQVSNISLKKKIFSATAVFKLGENPLEAAVSGPLKGRSIEGTFSVTSKGQKVGDGTFSVTKDVPAKATKKN